MHHGSSVKTYFVPLKGKKYDVGRSVQNDIILLSKSVPKKAFTLNRCRGFYRLPVKRVGDYSFRLTTSYFFKMMFVCVCMGLGAYASGIGSAKPKEASHESSPSIVALPTRETFSPANANASVAFSLLEDDSKSLILHYRVSRAMASGELSVSVNGHIIGYAPPANSIQKHEARLLISKNRLKPVGNEISFLGNGSTDWTVSQVYVTLAREEDELSLDPYFLYQAAHQTYEHRSMISDAAERAMDYLASAEQVCVDQPSLKTKIINLKARIERESLDSAAK